MEQIEEGIYAAGKLSRRPVAASFLNAEPADVKFELRDSTAVRIAATLPGENAFTSILTTTNPDKQFCILRFDIA